MNRKVITTKEELMKALLELSTEEVAFDTETTSLKYTELEVTGVSFCDGEHNYYVPIKPENRDWMHAIGMYIRSVKKVIAHNWVYDAKVMYKYGIDLTKTKKFDTMIAHHLLDENSLHGLKHLTRTILNREVEEYDETLSHYSEEFYQYALDDSLNTWLLYKEFLPKIFSQGLEKLMFKIEMPFQNCLLEMAIEGVTIDTGLLLSQQKDVENKILGLSIDLHDHLGARHSMQMSLVGEPTFIGSINFNSTHQLIDIFNKLGLEITEKTPSGNPSVGKATMSKHKKHPFVKILQEYKDYFKLYRAFIGPEGQIVKNMEEDGKVRPNFRDTGTKTGRMSCNSPNLQQLPNNKDNLVIKPRELFCAPEGYKMFSCDYSGQEVYTMAHLSKDPDLINMLVRGQDQHLINANAVFKLGIPEDMLEETHPDFKETKKKYAGYRKKGKVFSFGVPYGMGTHKCSRDFGVTEDEAEEMMNNLKGKFPRLFEAIDETHKECDANFQVKSLAGRVRHFGEDYKDVKLKNKNLSTYKPEIITLMRQGAAHRQSFNFKIQGLCADMIRAAMINVWSRKRKNPEWGLKTIMQVHDEANFIVKEEYVEEATAMVKKAFEDVTIKFIVPLTADIIVGSNYGNAK